MAGFLMGPGKGWEEACVDLICKNYLQILILYLSGNLQSPELFTLSLVTLNLAAGRVTAR